MLKPDTEPIADIKSTRHFFAGALPISFHTQVSDALSPVTVMGMLLRLAIFSKCNDTESMHEPSPLSRTDLVVLIFGFTERHLESSR